MKQGGAPPRKRKRREAAAETETEAEHPDLSTVTEAEHPDLSTVTEAERRSPRCWLLDRVGGELAERDRLLAERKRLLAERDRQIAWKETKIREMQAHIKDIHAMQLRLGLCLSIGPKPMLVVVQDFALQQLRVGSDTARVISLPNLSLNRCHLSRVQGGSPETKSAVLTNLLRKNIIVWAQIYGL
jgi:hypothetical protein